MIVAIHAFDNTYCGLHGIEHHRIYEVDSMKEAEELASDESREVIESFVMDEMTRQADTEVDFGTFEEGSDEYEQYVNDCIEEDIAYQIWEVVDNYATLEQMEEDFYNDKDSFIKEHCRELD